MNLPVIFPAAPVRATDLWDQLAIEDDTQRMTEWESLPPEEDFRINHRTGVMFVIKFPRLLHQPNPFGCGCF